MPRFARGAQTRRTIDCLAAIRGPNSLQKKHAPARTISGSRNRLVTEWAASVNGRFQASEALSTLRLPALKLYSPGGLLCPLRCCCAHPHAKGRHPFSRPDISWHCLHVVRPTSAIDVLGDPQNPPERSSLSHHSANEPQRRPRFVCRRCRHERYSERISTR